VTPRADARVVCVEPGKAGSASRAAGDRTPSGRRPLSDQRTEGLPIAPDPFRLKAAI
jgi:hypothetical protein